MNSATLLKALDPTLNQTYIFLTEFLSEQAELFADPLIKVCVPLLNVCVLVVLSSCFVSFGQTHAPQVRG
jgi:hypothetical protein